jgi:hypothetical protein
MEDGITSRADALWYFYRAGATPPELRLRRKGRSPSKLRVNELRPLQDLARLQMVPNDR